MYDFLDLKFVPAAAGAYFGHRRYQRVGFDPDVDAGFDIVQPGAFDESIAERGLRGPKSIKLLINHDRNRIAGVIDVLETRESKLWIEAKLNLAVSYANDLYLTAKTVEGLSFSVGFRTLDYEYVSDSDIRRIKKGDLREVSVVTFPMNDEAIMTQIKSEDVATVSEFERFLVSNGLVQSRNAAQRVTLAVKTHVGLFNPKPADKPLLADAVLALRKIKEDLQ